MPRLPLFLSREERLIKVYRDAYVELLRTIERKSVKGSLATFERALLADVTQILQVLDKELKNWVEKELPEIYSGSAETVYDAFLKAGVNVPGMSSSFAKVNKSTIQVLADNMTGNLQEATTYIGRLIQDEWRRAAINLVTTKVSTGKTVQQAKQMLMQRIGDEGLGAFKDSKGRIWRLDSYAEMVIRTTTREAANAGMMTQLQDMGKDLVQFTRHFATCSICAPYVGRVFSISGDDSRYPRLKSVPGFDKGYYSIHPNCRHVLSPYMEELADDPYTDRLRSNVPLDDSRTRAQIDTYNKAQQEKRHRMTDRNQWESYKAWLPEDAPKTFAGFRKMKAEYSERYQELRAAYRQIKIKSQLS